MKKKLFSIIMCVLMVMCFMPTATFADPLVEGDPPAAGEQTADGAQEATPAVDVAGNMTGADFLAKATENVITLTGDVNLTSHATISFDLTINLNGHTLSTTDAVTNQMNMLNVTAGTLTINGSGTVTRADITNPSSYTGQGRTINMSGKSNLTVQNGADIKGYKGINTEYGGHAIYAYTTGTIIIDHSTVQGGDCEKSGVTEKNSSSFNYKYKGEAGNAIEVYGSTLILSNAKITGGKGLSTNGTPAKYFSNGINHAEGGAAIYMYKTSKGSPTAEIKNSIITGGNSDLHNAEDAIQAAGTLNIENSTLKGGSCYNTVENYGIAGSAIYQQDRNNPVNITIKNSSVAGGGDSSGSWIGYGIELNNVQQAKILVENSTISGGQACLIANGKGNAIYIPKINNYSSKETVEHDVSLRNVTLYSHEKADGNGSVIYDSYGPSSVTMSGNIKITSGILKNVNISVPEGETFTVSGTVDTTGGSVAVPEGYLISADRISLPVAQVGDAKYATFQEALSAAKAGQTIKLLDDVTVADDTKGNTLGIITITKDLVIDGDEHKITFAQTTDNSKQASGINIESSAKVTLKDLTLDANKTAKHGINIFGGDVSLESVTIKNFTGYGVVVQGKATATNLVTTDCGWGGVNVDVKSYNNNSELTLKSGKVASVVVEHTVAATTYTSKATITGGTASNGVCLYDGSKAVATLEGARLDITGGTFGADPSAYLTKEYAAVGNTDGTWTVKKVEEGKVEVKEDEKTGTKTVTETTDAGTTTTETKSDGTSTTTTVTNPVENKEAGTTTTTEKKVEVKKDKDQNDVKTTTETTTVENKNENTKTETENKVEVVKSNDGKETKTETKTTIVTDSSNKVVSETSTATVTKADNTSTVTVTTVTPTKEANKTETTAKVTEKDAQGNVTKTEETKATITEENGKTTTTGVTEVKDANGNLTETVKTEEVKTDSVTSTEKTVTKKNEKNEDVVVTTKTVEDKANDVAVKTKVENNTAKVEAKIAENKATAEAGTAASATITVDATAASVDTSKVAAAEVTLPTTTVTALKTAAAATEQSKKVEAVELKTNVATLKIDNTALKTLTENAGEDKALVLTVEKKDTSTQQEGDSATTTEPTSSNVTATFELTAKIGGEDTFKETNSSENGTITINVPYTPSNSRNTIRVYYVNGDTRTEMDADYSDGVLSWGTNHFSTFEVEETERTSYSGGSGGGSVAPDTSKDDKSDDTTPAEEDKAAKVKELAKDLKLKASSSKTKKGNIKVKLTVDADEIKAIEDLGYTVKYKFYRSTKKSASYKAKFETAGKTYTNTSGKKGTRYYYKARVMVYDNEGTLITYTTLKQCRYACRVR